MRLEITPLDHETEIKDAIETLVRSEHRLAELTSDQIDWVKGASGDGVLLGRAQDQLHRIEIAKKAAILNALPAAIALLDRGGRVTSANDAWLRFRGRGSALIPGAPLGANYLDACAGYHRAGSLADPSVADAIRAVLAGDLESFSHEYDCRLPEGEAWFQLALTPFVSPDISGAVVTHLNITDRKANETLRQLLVQEVDHRAKNLLAIVQAVVAMTNAPTKETFVEAVSGRIAALARTHSILADNGWHGGDLIRIITGEIEPYGEPGQVMILGPSVELSLHAVQPVGLIIHELATNAVKYGALSVEQGWIDIELEILPGGALRLCWTERGGPDVAPPSTTGFGTTLVTLIANKQLKGDIELTWPATGMKFVATLPPSTYLPARST